MNFFLGTGYNHIFRGHGHCVTLHRSPRCNTVFHKAIHILGIDTTQPESKKLQAEFDTYVGYIAPEHEPTEEDLRWTGPCMVWFCRFLLLCLVAGFACLIAWAATWVPRAYHNNVTIAYNEM